MRGRRLVLSALLNGLVLASACAAPADAGAAGSKTFQAWTATCDNIGACVVIGSAEPDLFYMRVARDAGATAPPAIKMVLATQEAFKGTGLQFAFAAVTKDKSILLDRVATTIASGDTSTATAMTTGEASLRIIAAIRDADRLAYTLGPSSGTLDLKGLSAALRWMDARQGRAGTPTALVAKGMTPIGQVLAPRDRPVVVAAPNGSVSAVARPVVSKTVLTLAKSACEAEILAAHEGAEAWRLAANLVLVSLPCLSGAYNMTSAFYLTAAAGGDARALALPRPVPAGDPHNPPNLLINASFDPRTMVLTEFAKGRGIGDCGALATWVWTGRAFEPLEASSLEACPGALSEDWPMLYRAVRR